MWALRAAVTGKTHGADLVAVLGILGFENVKARIESAIK